MEGATGKTSPNMPSALAIRLTDNDRRILWQHCRAHGMSISDLVRQAIKEKWGKVHDGLEEGTLNRG